MLAAAHALVDDLIARGITDPDDVDHARAAVTETTGHLDPHSPIPGYGTITVTLSTDGNGYRAFHNHAEEFGVTERPRRKRRPKPRSP
ncbi:hypothetical protein SAMN05443637_115112 [Pseudonocardia thermophila]|mgnify:FL=1|uniref:Uncharacterized protein n=2 Tax=Pseudonocardia thermophila TaxID=1848 RepID=A0A1M6WUH5_PSETH|nr:hypothetical protein [Pseudonocardia thermophila]SHK97239.1 hypothetical protein SAMN05443637_115112 [Pseudonocardia thermophila]